MSWETDKQGRKVFKLKVDADLREAFMQAVMEEPLTEDGWLYLLWMYTGLLRENAAGRDRVPFGTALQFESSDEFLARFEEAQSESQEITPNPRTVRNKRISQEELIDKIDGFRGQGGHENHVN